MADTSDPSSKTGIAYSRAGLLGNPSDVYQGKALAFAIEDFHARVWLEPAERFELVLPPGERVAQPTFGSMAGHLRSEGCYGGLRLLRAAIRQFSGFWDGWRDMSEQDPRQRCSMRYESTIPRQAGLAGSSAIVIAALRALSDWFGVSIDPHTLANMALEAERQDLGITAGPMDRGIQAHEGLLYMDFKEPRTPSSNRRLSTKLLPPLFIAWDPEIGQISGVPHDDVKARWLRHDPQVLDAMARFPVLVEQGLQCLLQGDVRGLMRLVDQNFDLRASIWPIRERDRQLVEIGRSRGAAVKFAGSGGAVVGVMEDGSMFDTIAAAYSAEGYPAIRPRIRQSQEPLDPSRDRVPGS